VVVCTKATLDPSEKWNLGFKLKVTEPTFTQAGTNIEVTNTRFSYTNSNAIDIVQNI